MGACIGKDEMWLTYPYKKCKFHNDGSFSVYDENNIIQVFHHEKCLQGKKLDDKVFRHNVCVYQSQYDKVVVSTRTFTLLSQTGEIYAYTQLMNNPHPNLPKLLMGCWDNESDYILLLFQYIEGFDLVDICDKKRQIEEEELKLYLRQVIDAMLYLKNTCKIAHSDISPENIILTDQGKCILIDLELCRNNNHVFVNMGKYQFLAPELRNGKKYSYCRFASDVWSVGVTMYVLLQGQFLFESYGGRTIKCLRRGVKLSSFEKRNTKVKISDEAWDLLNKMIVYRPGERIKLDKILEHEWFQNT